MSIQRKCDNTRQQPFIRLWWMLSYYGIRMSDATVSRILRRNGMNRLSRGTRMRKVHIKRYTKQVPDQHIQMTSSS